MNRIRFLCVLAMVMVSAPVRAEVGFHFFDQPDLPVPVAATRNFVYQLVSLGGDLKHLDLTGMDDSALERKADEVSRNRWRPDVRKPAVLAELRLCRSRGVLNCPYYDGMALSTAFLLKEPRFVIATRHGVQAYLDLLENELGIRETELPGMRFPVSLLGAGGKLIRDAGTGLQLRKLDGKVADQGYDLSLFDGDLDSSLQGIPFSATPSVSENTELYAVGYPGETNTRQALGKRDAVEDTLSWTLGHGTSAAALRNSDLNDYMYTYDEGKPLQNRYLITDLDASGGMSGGPVLDPAGNAIGVVIQGEFDQVGNPPEALVVSNLVQLLDPLCGAPALHRFGAKGVNRTDALQYKAASCIRSVNISGRSS